MARCLVYSSKAAPGLSSSDVRTLVAAAKTRNEAIGIAGCLLQLPGHFVQVLEGRHAEVEAVFGRVFRDVRHHSIAVAMDQRVSGRLFATRGMDLMTQSELTEIDLARLSDAIARSRGPDPDLPAEGWRLLEPLAGIKPGLIHEVLRTRPLQPRAQLTVDRLVGKARQLALRDGPQSLTVENVAEASCVSYQTAYRYFATPADLLRAVVRQEQARQHHQFRVRLCGAELVSDEAVARFVAGLFVRVCGIDGGASKSIRMYMLRHHHDIPFDGLWALAADIVAAMRRAGRDTSDPALEEKLGAALAGIAAAVKMTALRDTARLQTPEYEAMIGGMILGALRGLKPV